MNKYFFWKKKLVRNLWFWDEFDSKFFEFETSMRFYILTRVTFGLGLGQVTVQLIFSQKSNSILECERYLICNKFQNLWMLMGWDTFENFIGDNILEFFKFPTYESSEFKQRNRLQMLVEDLDCPTCLTHNCQAQI